MYIDMEKNNVVSEQLIHFDVPYDVAVVSIEDSVKEEGGYINLPDKLPLGIFIGWVIQFIVLAIGGTSMYYDIKSQQASQREAIIRLENNMYTKQEAMMRIEMNKIEIEKMRVELQNLDDASRSQRK